MKKRSLVLLSSIFLLAIPNAPLVASKAKPFRSEEEADAYLSEHYNQGCAYYNQRSWYRASNEFEKVIYFFPCTDEAARSSYYLAVCYFEMGEYDFANEEFSNYLKASQHPEFFEDAVYSKFCIAEYFKTGKKKRPFKMRYLPKWVSGQDSALAIYDEVVAAMPNNDLTIRALKSKAELLCSMQEFRDCIETYQLIIRRFPKNEIIPDCYLNIAEAYYQQSRYEYQNPDILALAELNLRKFKDEFPRDERVQQAEQTVFQIKELYAKGLCDLGLFYERMGKPEASAIYFQSAIEEFPDTKVSAFCRARLKSLGYPKEGAASPAVLDEVKPNDENESLPKQETPPKVETAPPIQTAPKEEIAPRLGYEAPKSDARIQTTNHTNEPIEETQWTTEEVVLRKGPLATASQETQADLPNAQIKHSGAADWIAEQIAQSEPAVNQQGLESHLQFAHDPTHPFEESEWRTAGIVQAERPINSPNQETQVDQVGAQTPSSEVVPESVEQKVQTETDVKQSPQFQSAHVQTAPFDETEWSTEEIVQHKRPVDYVSQEPHPEPSNVSIKHTDPAAWIGEQITHAEHPVDQQAMEAHLQFAHDPTHPFEETSWMSHEVVQAERPVAQPSQEAPTQLATDPADPVEETQWTTEEIIQHQRPVLTATQDAGSELLNVPIKHTDPGAWVAEQIIPSKPAVNQEGLEAHLQFAYDPTHPFEETSWISHEVVQAEQPAAQPSPSQDTAVQLATDQTPPAEEAQQMNDQVAKAELPSNQPTVPAKTHVALSVGQNPEDFFVWGDDQSALFEETPWATHDVVQTQQPASDPKEVTSIQAAADHPQTRVERPEAREEIAEADISATEPTLLLEEPVSPSYTNSAEEHHHVASEPSAFFVETPRSTDQAVQSEQPSRQVLEEPAAASDQLAESPVTQSIVYFPGDDESTAFDADQSANESQPFVEMQGTDDQMVEADVPASEQSAFTVEENTQLTSDQPEPQIYDRWTGYDSMQSTQQMSQEGSTNRDDYQTTNHHPQTEDNVASTQDAVTQYYMHYSLMKNRKRRVRE